MIFIITQIKNKNRISKVLVLFFWLLVWQLLAMIINKEILFPTPIKVFLHLKDLIITKDFWVKVLSSFKNILIAYFLAVIVGTIFGMLCYYVKLFDNIISPIISIIKSVPVPSVTMLFLFYMKSKNLPILVSFIMVMPLVLDNVKAGFSNVDIQIIEMANTFNMSLLNKIRHVYLPETLPYFFAALQSGIGLAWKAGISSEITAYPINSIGKMINDSKVYLDSKGLFAWTLVVVILSMILEKVAKFFIENASKKLRYTSLGDLK